MNPVNQFEIQFSRLRGLILREKILRVCIFALFLSLLLFTIALGIQKTGLFKWEGYAVYPLIILFSIALSGLRGLRKNRGLQAELIGIDQRLRLKERLSTAFEYHRPGRKSSMSDLLMMDAAQCLESIRRDQISPRGLSPLYILIPLFSLLLMLLFFVDLSPADRKTGPPGQERLRELGIRMERFSRQKPENTAGKGLQSEVYKEMEKIATELKKGDLKEKRFLKSVGMLKKSVSAENARLGDRLRKDLIAGDPSSLPMLNPLLKERPDPEEMGEMMKSLKDLFGGEIPASLKEDLDQLESNLKIEGFLEDIMVRSGLETWGKEDSIPQDTLPDLSTERAFKGGDGSDSPPSSQEKRSLFTAGTEKAKGIKEEAKDLEGAKGPMIRDEGISGPGEQYNDHIRSLPVIGRAETKTEDVYRPYEQALEAALVKEDMPPEQREIVKNYFLSIGLGTEGHGDENNP